MCLDIVITIYYILLYLDMYILIFIYIYLNLFFFRLVRLYYVLMGARIGSNVKIHKDANLGQADLLTIGMNTYIYTQRMCVYESI
jgi:hypothetical protein